MVNFPAGKFDFERAKKKKLFTNSFSFYDSPAFKEGKQVLNTRDLEKKN
jgi:hypothetical protein